MGKIIHESGCEFGEFVEDNLFYIEHSNMLDNLGKGIKTVEFITRLDDNIIMFLEAKTGCPNPSNKLKDSEVKNKYIKFYDDIAEKFRDSLQIFTAGILERYEKTDEIGVNLKKVKPLRNKEIYFVLVITADEILEDWLNGPKLELEERLRKIMKIWKVKVIVLNTTLAKKFGIIR